MIEIKQTNLKDLGLQLIEYIKNRKNIFETINIVVPNSKTEQWFKSFWLKTQNDILMNVKFENVDDALLKMTSCKDQFKLLNKDRMTLLIIKNLIEKKSLLDLPQNILNYIEISKSNSNIRLYDLACKLSELFIEYEKDQFNFTGWERNLYDYVLIEAGENNYSTLSYIYNCISNKETVDIQKNIYFFGFHNLSNLHKDILSNYEANDKVKLFSLSKKEKYNNEFHLTAAPSKLREIESLHSKICKLIKDENIEYSDVLVLGTDISFYENIIARVFKQDNVNFYNVPYVINDRKKVETNLSKGLEKLFEIINKKYYTRLDFFELINNKDIQNSRNISDKDVRNWSESIVNMNCYRNFNNRNDWEYAKKRVLISKLSSVNDTDNNIVEFNDGKYIPYSNIDFDDESIVKFVNVIDDLQSWLDNILKIEYVNSDNLITLKNELVKWFSIKDDNDFETNEYFKNILSLIDMWIELNFSNDLVSFKVLIYMLIDASKVTSFKARDYFVRGITFSDFDVDAILSAKYIFFLNAGSKELPKQVFKSELDLRDYDISQKEKYLNAFFLQYQNAENQFFISYLNKNLKTDEELYLSSIVIDLFNKINKDNNIEKSINDNKEVITIDETRNWDELFTKKSFKDKDYYVGLIGKTNSNDELGELNFISDRRKKIRSKEMADFLEEPLKYKSNYLFSKDSKLNDDMNDEYEPFEVDSITKSVLMKNICLYALENGKLRLDMEDGPKLLERFNLGRKLPDINNGINMFSFRTIIDEANIFLECVEDKTKIGNDYNYEVIDLEDISFTHEYYDGDELKETEWTLTCKDKVCRSLGPEYRMYIQIKTTIKDDDDYQYLQLYIMSLMDIVKLPENNYVVKLIRSKDYIREFIITPYEAEEVLSKIYTLINDFSDNVCLPVKLFKEKINSLHEFVNQLNSKAWKYFDDKNLYDYYTQLGYTEDNFLNKYAEKKNEVIDLIKFMKKDLKESEGNEGEKI